ncbi:MAG TPA: hypothetical protein VMK12_22340 [Anaeromyxobacteraceae bacterium]|nr:hypothetical protein [Anaeromyxobacteraceae bacterium]
MNRGDGRRTKLVDRLAIHGLVDFRALCQRAVPEETRYLILDLDRTLHLGRNMGELLGWELSAHHGYGPDRLADAEGRRSLGRFFFDWSRPAAVLRYLAITARMWALPGLFYFLFGKLPAYLDLTRRLSFRTFGPEPVAAVQRVPQTALMHHMSAVPISTLRMLAQRVWRRYQCDQVIEREDLAWLRSRCPAIRILITSASPKPTLEVAAEALGVDDIVYSAIEEHEGYFSSPYQIDRLFLLKPPRRISGPNQVRFNSGRVKIETLLERYPELADGVVSVGISDTGYGEDHCWAEHFTRVVDVNSSTPFPAIVPATSPVQEIHSALVLTRSERVRRAAGEGHYLDPRRALDILPDRVFMASDLAESLAHVAGTVETLTGRFAECARSLTAHMRSIDGEMEEMKNRIQSIVAGFNEAPSEERRTRMVELRHELKKERSLRRRLTRLERPLSSIAFELAQLLARTRTDLLGDRTGRSGAQAG